MMPAKHEDQDMSGRITSIRIGSLAALLASSLALPACAAETVVDQHDLTFVPSAVTINAGDTVRFTDTDHITHNITITNPDGTSDDKGMDRYGQDIAVPFATAGVFHVHCKIHPTMKMTVTVK
jgi:plastocyanin